METVLLYVFIALQLGDVWTTQYALRNIKGSSEANPVVKAAMDKLGIMGGLLAIKAPVIALFWFLPMPLWALVVVVALYVYIVGNNARIILKHK
jgi:predicted CDP-diglyceride synthetase/phosphatidate cytidylyltransferase